MKRQIAGWILAAIGLLQIFASSAESSAALQLKALLAGVTGLGCGAAIAAAGTRARAEKRAVRDAARQLLSRDIALSLREVARQACVSLPLADRFLRQLRAEALLPAEAFISSPLPTTPACVPWRLSPFARKTGSALEILLSDRLDRPITLLAFHHSCRLSRARYLLIIAGVILLLFPILLMATLFALPGVVFLTWTFSSNWDENEALGTTQTAVYVGSVLFSFIAGGALATRLFLHRRTHLLARTPEAVLLVTMPETMDGMLRPFRSSDLHIEPVTALTHSGPPGRQQLTVLTPSGSHRFPVFLPMTPKPGSPEWENLQLLATGQPQTSAAAAS